MDDNKLLRDLDILDPANYSSSKSISLYHYTTLNGAVGIFPFSLSEKEFILKHKITSEFKDKNIEGKEFDKVFLEDIKDALDLGRISKIVYEELKSLLKNYDYTYLLTKDFDIGKTNIINKRCNVYIASFSESLNEEMASNYCKGTYCSCFFEVSRIDLEECAKSYFGKGYIHRIDKVIYKRFEKDKIINDFIDSVKSRRSLKTFTNLFISTYKFLFKSERLRNENEVRSVYILPNSEYSNKIIDVPFTNQSIFGFGYKLYDLSYDTSKLNYILKRFKKISL